MPEALVYCPECGWVVERPQVHFNKELLRAGEPLKVLWRPPRFSWRDYQKVPFLRISSLNEEGGIG